MASCNGIKWERLESTAAFIPPVVRDCWNRNDYSIIPPVVRGCWKRNDYLIAAASVLAAAFL